MDDGLTVGKIEVLLRLHREVPYRTSARFAVERCGAGRRTTTVRVDDPMGAENFIQTMTRGYGAGGLDDRIGTRGRSGPFKPP
ncbi:MAG: hypothetical protein ABSC31_15635 [Acidimicrobiales bacterium]